MNTIALDVKGNALSVITPAVVTGGSANVDQCAFVFNEAWLGFTKIAVFATQDEKEFTAGILSNRCTIPAECLKTSGLLRIGVVGKKDDQMMSTNFVVHQVIRGANENAAAVYNGTDLESAVQDVLAGADADNAVTDGMEFMGISDEPEPLSPDMLCESFPSYAKKIEAEGCAPVYEFSRSTYDRIMIVKLSTPYAMQAFCGVMQAVCEQNDTNAAMYYLFHHVKILAVTENRTAASLVPSEENRVVFALELTSDDAVPFGKKILYTSAADDRLLVEIAGRFDCLLDADDPYRTTVILKNKAEDFSTQASAQNGVNACRIIWREYEQNTAAAQRFTAALLYAEAKRGKYPELREAAPFSKHIFWRGEAGGASDAFALTGTMAPMWLSHYQTALCGGYDMTLTGYAVVQSAAGDCVTLRPVLYQENSEKTRRFSSDAFDVQMQIPAGVSVVPFNGVIYGSVSCDPDADETAPGKIGAVLCAKAENAQAQIIGFSYTLSGIPAPDGTVEMLVPQGLTSDYEDEETLPVYLVKTFEEEEENEQNQ